MDNTPGPSARTAPASNAPGAPRAASASTSPSGGSVAPANRAALAQQTNQASHQMSRQQTPSPQPAATQYELRDPFAEVTYRSKTFTEMAAKADQLGATRFTAIDPKGQRSPVHKVEGVWQAAAADRPRAPSAVNEAPSRGTAEPAGPTRSNARPAPETTSATSATSTTSAASTSKPNLARLDEQAARAAHAERLQAELHERYVIKRPLIKAGDVSVGRTEYRFRGDNLRVAFTESPFRLSTDTNNPAVARSMVDVAEARNWRALRVSGNEDFKRLAWLEASVRGIQTVGYTPHRADIELMHKEREARQTNRIERSPAYSTNSSATDRTLSPGPANQPAGDATKSSARGNGGRKTVLAALEAVLIANRVPPRQREAVMTAAADNLAQRLSRGEVHKVKVYDHAAPAQRPAMSPEPQPQRNRERAAPSR